jgi:hypothetical protein
VSRLSTSCEPAVVPEHELRNDEGPSTHELEGPRRSCVADRRLLGARRHRTSASLAPPTDRSAGPRCVACVPLALRPIARPVRCATLTCRPLPRRSLGRCASSRRPSRRPRRPIARPARLSSRCPVRFPSDCSAGAPRDRPARFPSDCSVGAPQDVAPSALPLITQPVRLGAACPVRSPTDCSAGAPPVTGASPDASRLLGRSLRRTIP